MDFIKSNLFGAWVRFFRFGRDMSFMTKFNAQIFVYLALFILFSLGMVIPKGYSWGVGVLLATALYIVVRYRKEIDFNSAKSLVYALLAYVLVSVFINLIAGHSGRDYELDARVLLTIPILYALIYSGFNRTVLMLIFAIGGLLMSIDAIYQHVVLNRARVGVYPIRYGYIGAWLAMATLISFISFAKTTRLWLKALLVLGVFGGLVTAILSGTRGSWLFLVIACVLLGLYGLVVLKGKMKLVLVAICAVFTIAVGVISVTDNPLSKRVVVALEEMEKYQPNHKDSYTSVGMRLEAWRLSVQMITDHPFTGLGARGFRPQVLELIAKGKAQKYMQWLNHPHNDIIDKAIRSGLISTLVLVLSLLLYPFIQFAKRLRHHDKEVRYYAVLGCMLVIAWFIFGLTDLFLMTNVGALYYLVSLALFWTGMRRLESQ